MALPIRARMTAWYVVLLAVIIGGIGAFLVLRLRADLTGAVDRSLRPAAAQIAAGYRAEGAPEFRDTARTVLAGERVAAQVESPVGAILLTFGDRVARLPLLSPAQRSTVLRGHEVTGTVTRGPDAQRFRFAARRVVRAGRPEVVVASESLATVDRSVHRVLVLLLLAGPAALLATALGGWWLARGSLRPIDRITTTARAIGVERLDERVAVPPTADEVAQLATTLNTMLDRIQHGVEEQHRLIADASHELRTPLATMRAEVDVSLRTDDLSPAARAVLESTREEVDRLTRTVEDLLTLASVDERGLALVVGRVDLGAVADDVATSLAALAAARQVSITRDGVPSAALGDPEQLRHAVRNLVENAIEFSPAGGAVGLTTWANERESGITVADDGPGVPPGQEERIFDRFYRADPSRTRRTGGSGLGLAISREIVVAHGGRIWAEGRAPRGGAFSIALPSARRAGTQDSAPRGNT